MIYLKIIFKTPTIIDITNKTTKIGNILKNNAINAIPSQISKWGKTIIQINIKIMIPRILKNILITFLGKLTR